MCVLPTGYLCVMCLICMCYGCATDVLPMCYICATDVRLTCDLLCAVLRMCYFCSTYGQSLRAIHRAESRRNCKVRGKRAHVQIAPEIVGRPTEPPARCPDPVAHHPLSGTAAVGSCRCRFSPTHTVVCNPLRALNQKPSHSIIRLYIDGVYF